MDRIEPLEHRVIAVRFNHLQITLGLKYKVMMELIVKHRVDHVLHRVHAHYGLIKTHDALQFFLVIQLILFVPNLLQYFASIGGYLQGGQRIRR